MEKIKIIPIFPLDLVLFPRQELPLRIFEPRYKQLIDDCMLGDGQFGVCLIDSDKTIEGWPAPKSIGTISKITKCQDIELGTQLSIDTIGRNKFKIIEIIPPSMKPPMNYDPYTEKGHQQISELHEKSGVDKKMYISAKVEIIPEIDDDIPLDRWKKLVELWKNKTIYYVLPKTISSQDLDQVLAQYYLLTDVPTIDYVYSLASLGAESPDELQPLLESGTIEELLQSTEELFATR